MLESNPPRNSRPQTHRDDEARGEAVDSSALGTNQTNTSDSRSAYASKNS
jgi:hypothetical protein